MSRAERMTIRQQASEIAGLRLQVAELRGEISGERRGKHVVSEQLAHDIRLGATREEQHRARAAQCYEDLQRALRLVAAHTLDCRDRAPEEVQLLEDAFTGAGISLRAPMIAVQLERANAVAKVSASEAAAAVATAPIPPRTGTGTAALVPAPR